MNPFILEEVAEINVSADYVAVLVKFEWIYGGKAFEKLYRAMYMLSEYPMYIAVYDFLYVKEKWCKQVEQHCIDKIINPIRIRGYR